MIRASFGQFWRGKYYEKDQPFPANEKQAKELVACKRAYLDLRKEVAAEPDLDTPTEKNTKAEIMAYLDADGISYDKSLTKAELLELC